MVEAKNLPKGLDMKNEKIFSRIFANNRKILNKRKENKEFIHQIDCFRFFF